MENVPQVICKDFEKWQLKLESLGYTNYVEILNAKDYGIPQNRKRCFMVSILGKYAYSFPIRMKLKYRLNDLLEDKVDEKYFLTQDKIEQIENWNSYEKPLDNVIVIDEKERKKEQIISTITTHVGKDSAGMKLVAFPKNEDDKKVSGGARCRGGCP